MTDEKCAICKKYERETPGIPFIKHHSPDGLVRYYHDGQCLATQLKWENYAEEQEPSDYGIKSSSEL